MSIVLKKLQRKLQAECLTAPMGKPVGFTPQFITLAIKRIITFI